MNFQNSIDSSMSPRVRPGVFFYNHPSAAHPSVFCIIDYLITFDLMKISAFILLLLVGFSTIQPVLGSPKKVETKCHKMMKCPKQGKPDGKETDDSCNPFMSCVYGNFYFAEKNIFSFEITPPVIDKITATNDNRLSEKSAECWHPPETSA